MADAGASAPTGCYKCGRPGHWSRDCPSSAPPTSNPNPNPPSSNFPSSSSFPKTGGSNLPNKQLTGEPGAEKPKKVPKTRPKLTPELLLSNEGLGYILRHFPRNFKYGGRGHEVSNLRNLLRMYTEWHSQLLPYYPFEQFVHKVEQVGSSKRVRICLTQLREKLANGVDLTKLNNLNDHEEALEEDPNFSKEASHQETPCTNMDVDDQPQDLVDDQPQDLVDEIYNQTVKEMSETSHAKSAVAPDTDLSARVEGSTAQHSASEAEDGHKGAESSNAAQISEEQRARMEASRKKALERAAARARLSANSL